MYSLNCYCIHSVNAVRGHEVTGQQHSETVTDSGTFGFLIFHSVLQCHLLDDPSAVHLHYSKEAEDYQH